MKEELLKAYKLPIFNSIADLSQELFLSKNLLFRLSKYSYKYYKTFNIHKKNGKLRRIDSPKYSLRVLQAWIKVSILEKLEVSKSAMAFKRGKEFGIKPNAEFHKDNEYVLRIDLKDFFGSIKRFQVYNIFGEIGYSNFMANILTNYCMKRSCKDVICSNCSKDECMGTYMLPQEATTSPILSNLIFYSIDDNITNFCNERDIIYTRYADDLIFSCNSFSRMEDELKPFIKKSIKEQGFEINKEKTKLLSSNNRKLVTGLIVNNKDVRVKREIRNKVRGLVFKDIIKGAGDLSPYTLGYLAFLSSVDNKTYNKINCYIEKLQKRRAKLEIAGTH